MLSGTLLRNLSFYILSELTKSRCGVVLKNIGTLFEASLLDNGATGFNFPPGPNVCPAPDANGNYAVVAPLL